MTADWPPTPDRDEDDAAADRDDDATVPNGNEESEARRSEEEAEAPQGEEAEAPQSEEGAPTPDRDEYSPKPPEGEDPRSPEPGPSGEEATDAGTPAEHESEVVGPPEPGRERVPEQIGVEPEEPRPEPEPEPPQPEPARPAAPTSDSWASAAEHTSEVVAAREPASSGDPEPPPAHEGADRVLIFLNEVAGGRKLLQATRELFDAGASYFAVVAPQNQPAVGQLVDIDELHEAAQSRVDVTQAVLSEFGVEAERAVMDRDSALALDDAVRVTNPDHILLSCLYESRFGFKRWDLVEWAKKHFDATVEHIPVRVDDDAIRWDLTHTLVVATKTVHSPDLLNRLKELASERPHRFTFICPSSGDVRGSEVGRDLAATLAEMYRNEIDATGQAMSPDPFQAVENAIEHYRVDDILISTLAGEQSKWLQEGLVERVRAITEKPVEHVETGEGWSIGTRRPAWAGAGAGSGEER